jgi:hypothetical protein
LELNNELTVRLDFVLEQSKTNAKGYKIKILRVTNDLSFVNEVILLSSKKTPTSSVFFLELDNELPVRQSFPILK